VKAVDKVDKEHPVGVLTLKTNGRETRNKEDCNSVSVKKVSLKFCEAPSISDHRRGYQGSCAVKKVANAIIRERRHRKETAGEYELAKWPPQVGVGKLGWRRTAERCVFWDNAAS